MAKPNWITLGTSSGSGNGQSSVQAAAYTGRSSRSGVITGTTEGDSTDTTSVTQNGKAEFIEVDSATGNVVNTGGTYVISGSSNSANIKVAEDTQRIDGVTYTIEVNEVEDDSWNGNSDTGIDGDPGASAQFTFKITATFPANTTGSSKTHKITLQNGNTTVSSEEITITQAAGTRTYANPVIETISYASDIPAEGGSITPNVTYSQTWGWNGSTTGGGTITTGGDLTFTGAGVDPDTGEVTASDLDTTVKSRTKVATASVTVVLNGKTSAAKTADAYQEANSAIYGSVTINGGSVSDIPASGGTVSSASGISATQTVTFTSGAERAGEVEITYSSAISGSNLGTTVTSRTKKGTLTATATGEGEEDATKSFDVYQAANTATYGNVTIGQTTPVSLQASGQTYQINPAAAQTVTYTSGASRNQTTSENPVEIDAEYTVKTPQTGFSLDGSSVTVTENPGTSARNGFVVTITCTGEGSKSATKDITFNQQGSESTLELTPPTMTFEATGGTQTLTITSNDSWTLS